MKRVILLAVVFVSVVSSFGQALSYRQKICALRGTNDTTVVTLVERIDYCLKEQSASYLRGETLKSAFTNHTQFTDAQINEFCLRSIRGSMTQLMTPCFTAASLIETNGVNSTDANLNFVYKNISWYIIKMIGNGSL